jgi:site-specific DNA recombinase
MQKKRVFIYVRVSTLAQYEEGYSIPQQIDRLQKYCEAMGYEVIKVYIEDGHSGGTMDRPALKQMLKEIAKLHPDMILVDKLDRLSRSQFDTLYMIQKIFEPQNVAFVSRAESFDTSSAFGKAMVGILAVFAELERSRIKERMIDGKEGRAKEGKYKGGGNVPIGFRYDKETEELIINEYEAEQVKEVYNLFLRRTPVNSIAKIMNDKGYRTKYGEWQGQTIRELILNPIYIGKIVHKGKVYEGLHDGFIDEKTYERAVALMAERDKENEKYKPGKRYKTPIGGMIWCGCCTAKYHWRANGRDKWGKKRGYYICYSRSKSDPKLVKNPNCKNKTYRDYELEEIIFGEIRRLKSEPAYIEELRESVDTSGKQKMLRKRIEQIESQVSKLMDLYTMDGIDLSVVKAKMNPLNDEKRSLEEELENLEEAVPTITTEEIVSVVDAFESVVESGDCYAIHAAISELIDHIVIDGEDIQIHWRF